MTEFAVWCPDLGEKRDDAVLIGADDVVEAAELWVERHEQRQAEYPVASGHEDIAVAVSREDAAFSDFVVIVDVIGVPRPRYLGTVR